MAMSGHKGLYGPQGTGILIAGELDHLSIKTLMEETAAAIQEENNA